MKERPILFSAPMVRAILGGTKTQTRRIMSPQPTECPQERGGHWWPSKPHRFMLHVEEEMRDYTGPWSGLAASASPYGQIGDQLWVREAWRIGAWDETRPAFALDYCDGPRKEWVDVPDPMCDEGSLFDKLWQQSTDDAIKAGLQTDDDGNYRWEPGQSPCRWRPSIHMPRWASRIQLEITGIRVERLQDISEADAMAEGIDAALCAELTTKSPWVGFCAPADVHAYAALWESINGAGAWEANPWVWVVEFRRIKP